MKKITRKIITNIRKISFIIINRIICLTCKLKENRILFLSDVRDELDGNLKYIYNNLDEEKCEKICLLKKDRKIKRKFKDKFELAYYISTSKYIILDDFSRFISIMKLRKGQEVCQTWHATGAFKTFGFSRLDKKDKSEKNWNNHRNYTKAIVTSDDIKWCYAEGFNMPIDHIKATGSPRTDVFFDKDYIIKKREELYNEYPFLKGKKVITFAPTYRGESLKKSYYDFDKIDLQKLYKELHENYIFIFKWHPGFYFNKCIKNNEQIYDFKPYEDFFYDFSMERDINDLLLVTDILITDYSSVVFEWAFLNRPIIYFVYDYDEYLQERGFYFDFNEYVYGKISNNSDELIKAIKDKSIDEISRKKFFNKFLRSCDGNSNIKTCKWIFEEHPEYLNHAIDVKIKNLQGV